MKIHGLDLGAEGWRVLRFGIFWLVSFWGGLFVVLFCLSFLFISLVLWGFWLVGLDFVWGIFVLFFFFDFFL